MRFCTAVLLIFFGLVTSPARGQTLPADEWRISVITFGSGQIIYERYGHVAIRFKNAARDIDVCYDWGNFDFEAPGFLLRFAKGDLRYWMEGKSTADMFTDSIHFKDRTVTEQVLNLSAIQSAKLRLLIVGQDDEDHRFYPYDYFKDNCSTRVRDAIDEATGGALQMTKNVQTPHSYRWHDRRLLSVGLDNIALNTGMEFLTGPRLDAPLSEWEACFLPTLLSQTLDRATIIDVDGKTAPLVRERRVLNVTQRPGNAEPADALSPAWWLLPMGLLGGGAIVLLARAWPLGFRLAATGWELFVLGGGLILTAMVAFTRHWPVAWNENFLQLTPVAVVVIWAIWKRKSTVQRSAWNWVEKGAPVALALSLTGALVTISHLTPQRNAAVLCLTVPLHTAVFVGLRRLRKGSHHASIENAPASPLTPT
jgi:hypothetical protein